MVMPKKSDALTGAERMRRLKARKKAGFELPYCRTSGCESRCTTRYTITLSLCSKCYGKTPEGREEARERSYFHRQMARLTDPKEKQKAIAHFQSVVKQLASVREYQLKLVNSGVPPEKIVSVSSANITNGSVRLGV